ncbi:alpha-tocopherol transfer protein-like [Chironomus tepperi]|uniref:alpha-tocopherol transfer protein-like n=1 Tax=Chironomus tepperi TaxID=113505 RepID=UPI00391F3847
MSGSLESLNKLISDNDDKLKKLEDWIATQKHIPKNISRNVLIRYLKVRDFDLEEAKKLIDGNVKFRIKNKYLFTNRDIESDNFQKLFSTINVARFPKLTKEGYSIEASQIKDSNASNFSIKSAIELVLIIHDTMAYTGPNTNGGIKIYDASEFSFQHFLSVVSSIQAAIHFSQYGSTYTLEPPKQIHFLHCSSFIRKLIRMLKPFFSKEIMESIHCHPAGFESLHTFIDKECLPVEYGGTLGTLEEHVKNTQKNLKSNRDFIINDENFFIISK